MLKEQLEMILQALQRIPRRFKGVETAEDFLYSDEGTDKLDAICMMLIAVGEGIKKLDHHTNGELLARYPQIDWKGVKGVRNVIAHGYFDIDVEQVFDICQKDIPELISVIKIMLKEAF